MKRVFLVLVLAVVIVALSGWSEGSGTMFRSPLPPRSPLPDGFTTSTTIRTRTVFVQAVTGRNYTDNADVAVTRNDTNAYSCIVMPDTKDVDFFASWQVPTDFVGGLTVRSVVIAGGTGNIFGQTGAKYGARGESYLMHGGTSGAAAEAATNNVFGYHWEYSLVHAAVGDIVLLKGDRRGSNVLDTVDADCDGIGFILTYTAYRQ